MVKLEVFVCDASNGGVLRCFAGACLLCCHGVKRWSDALHWRSWEVAGDSLLFTTWKSKKKTGPLEWACTLRGFSDVDWVTPFPLGNGYVCITRARLISPAPKFGFVRFHVFTCKVV